MNYEDKINPVSHEQGNCEIYVSNGSKVINPVDIMMALDEKLALKKDFEYNKVGPYDERLHYKLEKGEHSLTLCSEKGEATKKISFELNDYIWIVISFRHTTEPEGGIPYAIPKMFEYQIFYEEPLLD